MSHGAHLLAVLGVAPSRVPANWPGWLALIIIGLLVLRLLLKAGK